MRKYEQNSIKYLLIMALYFHGLGIAAAYGGEALIEIAYPSYQAPEVTFPLFDLILAGPIEETLFFGIPFYASGNPYIVLITGSIWALLHILNTDLFAFSALSYGNFLFAALSLVYSLRTWASGKGWFSIVVHSGWNGSMFALDCGINQGRCEFVGETYLDLGASIGSAILGGVLVLVTYALYRRSRRVSYDSVSILSSGSSATVGYSSISTVQKKPTVLWYAVPILLSIIGGIIMYFALRNKDRKMANKGMLVGVLALIANIAFGVFF